MEMISPFSARLHGLLLLAALILGSGCGTFLGGGDACDGSADCLENAICQNGVCRLVDEMGEIDAGQTPSDAGMPAMDAGLPPVDAGPLDAGSGTLDSGNVNPPDAGDGGSGSMDAGTTAPEAGSQTTDGGSELPDSSTPIFDAGLPLADSGVSPPPDAGPPMMDAGPPPPDSGPPPPAATCGGPEIFYQDFSGNIGTQWISKVDVGTSAVVADDKLQLKVLSGTTGPVRTSLKSRAAFSLVGARTWIHMDSASNDPSALLQPYLRFEEDAENYVEIRKTGGLLELTLTNGGSQDSTYVSYQADQDAFWQMRESNGSIYFETSPDSFSWNPLRTLNSVPFVDVGEVRIGAELISGTAGSDLGVFFDHLNFYVSSAPLFPMNFCPISDFSVNFYEADWPRHWSRLEQGSCAITTGSGQIQMNVSSVGSCRATTRSAYLVEGELVEISLGSGAAGGTDWFTGVALVHPWDAFPRVSVGLNSNGIVWGHPGSLAVTAVATNPLALRMVESAGTIYFSHSDNGSVFEVAGSIPTPVGFDFAQIQLFLGNEDNMGISSASRAFTQVN